MPPTIPPTACAPPSRRKTCRNSRSSPTTTPPNTAAPRAAWSTSSPAPDRTSFHGDVYGYLRNRDFQAVNPFSTTSNPAYTRVQAGTAFGGPIKKDKTYYFFSYEVTRRHETGFSAIAPAANPSYYGLTGVDARQSLERRREPSSTSWRRPLRRPCSAILMESRSPLCRLMPSWLALLRASL